MAKRPYGQSDIDKRAIELVRGEKLRWELATAFVTDRVSFKMRQLIRICRKNYYGIFDNPFDPNTNMEKIWYPLTEINVEAVIKNIDLDQKDIQFRSTTPDAQPITELTRAAVKNKLSSIYFGQKLNDFERQLCIDGTAVWKTYEENGKLVVLPVDLLNIYIDPTSPSIQEAYRFTERSLMFADQIKAMNGWENTDGVEENVTEGLPRTDPYYMNRANQVNSNVKALDVYETWGMIPKSLITHRKEDDTIEVPGHIVVSGIDSPGKERCHLIEENTKKDTEGNSLKPYEEAWYTRVPNRWYGRGIAEKLLTLQIYANIVFNVRINRSRISQLGLFKMKKGAGVTPQMLNSLTANGVITLNNLDDLQQMVVQEVGATSYKDEDVINAISERLTNAFEIATGEDMPASTPATNAALQNQAAKSGFSLIKEGMGLFLERWMDRHALPIILNEITSGDIIRFETDDDAFKKLVDHVVMAKAHEALEEAFNRGYLPSDLEVQMAIQDATEKVMRGSLFFKLVKKLMADQYETKVFVGNEETDPNVTITNLLSMLKFAPQYSEAIVKQTFDLMGLPMPNTSQPQMDPLPGQPPTPVSSPIQAQQQLTGALTQ